MAASDEHLISIDCTSLDCICMSSQSLFWLFVILFAVGPEVDVRVQVHADDLLVRVGVEKAELLLLEPVLVSDLVVIGQVQLLLVHQFLVLVIN